MNQDLINKYFRDECSEEELDEVLDWFQTDEGRAFLEKDIEKQRQYHHDDTIFLPSLDFDSEAVFRRIQSYKKKKKRRNFWILARVASLLLIACCLSAVLYWGGVISLNHQDPVSDPIMYSTTQDQQKVLKLPDGTTVRLNENSKLVFPQDKESDNRIVQLTGEAYLEVAHNPSRPFIVNTKNSSIEVLGTKFNVKSDTVAGNIQVAVVEGKVSLKKGEVGDVGAILTKNHFGILETGSDKITIENTRVANYMSWIDMRLVFDGESLFGVSRQLERLYNVEIKFGNDRMKRLNLTANFERSSLKQVLRVIANTLEINYRIQGKRVTWIQ